MIVRSILLVTVQLQQAGGRMTETTATLGKS